MILFSLITFDRDLTGYAYIATSDSKPALVVYTNGKVKWVIHEIKTFTTIAKQFNLYTSAGNLICTNKQGRILFADGVTIYDPKKVLASEEVIVYTTGIYNHLSGFHDGSFAYAKGFVNYMDLVIRKTNRIHNEIIRTYWNYGIPLKLNHNILYLARQKNPDDGVRALLDEEGSGHVQFNLVKVDIRTMKEKYLGRITKTDMTVMDFFVGTPFVSMSITRTTRGYVVMHPKD